MANTFLNGDTSGEMFVAGPQVSHGGIMNIHFASRTVPVSTISKPFTDIPYPSGPDYIDRPVIEKWLQEKLHKSPSRAALVGLGGIGYVLLFPILTIFYRTFATQHADITQQEVEARHSLRRTTPRRITGYIYLLGELGHQRHFYPGVSSYIRETRPSKWLRC